ncbi:hypothetical protein P6144_05335 [Sphingomonas sp. HITSZ_GF]|uniref:hypothetical protein n=1 Tax=Sphingomonas sp. HITSZ_GF TaxID=3037247 RepID=UPI00240E395E|nr:hypothetical protein [Sphingomonas sp. HITSZ_GF]MDG2533060.1 hypothetical protein [Sphingomonas sp. HITSZ_GF]
MAKAKQEKKPASAPVRRTRAAPAPAPVAMPAPPFAPEPTWVPGKFLSQVDLASLRHPDETEVEVAPPRAAPPQVRPTAMRLGARLGNDPLPRGRFAPRRPAVRSGAHADDIFAEVDGNLVQYRLENGTTMRRIPAFEGVPGLRSSPVLVPTGPRNFALYCVVGPDRRLWAGQFLETDSGTPVIASSNAVLIEGGFLGDPVLLPGLNGAGSVIARLAVRVTGGVVIYDVGKDGSLKPTCSGKAILPIGEVHGRIAGLSDPIANVFVPQSPIKNGFVNTGNPSYGERLLPPGPGEPNGDVCVINTIVPKTVFHLFVPSGQKTLYFRGTDSWTVEEIPFRLDGMAAEHVTPSRTVVLGRVGQRLCGFSFDVASDGKVKLNLAAPPFGQAITGDPVLFRGYAPDGDVHLAAIVYAEVNKLLYLWYDHGNDSWSLLPP